MHSRDLASLAGEETIFGGFAAEKLKRLQAELEPLSRRYDVVVANPPYMGSKNMNKWLGDWIKTHYKDVKGDLFSCFMMRNVGMGAEHAQLGFMTPYVWMFIGTYEKLRKFVIKQNTITSLIQLEYSGFSGATVPICTFTLQKGYCPGYRGGYVRLSDFVGADQQAPRALEALANPDCGWFYRCSARMYDSIPGTPIVYWASKAIASAFKKGLPVSSIGQPRQGLATGENARFVRQWWEVSLDREWFDCPSIEESAKSGLKWFPYNKGGEYRKWYGNNDCVVNWKNDGYEIRNFVDAAGRQLSRPQNTSYYFKPCTTWSKISSGSIAFRYKPAGHVFDVAGTSIFANSDRLSYLQGACNSSVILKIANMLSPTLNFEVGQIAAYPIVFSENRYSDVNTIVEECRSLSRSDWDSAEVSWDFKHHPLI